MLKISIAIYMFFHKFGQTLRYLIELWVKVKQQNRVMSRNKRFSDLSEYNKRLRKTSKL